MRGANQVNEISDQYGTKKIQKELLSMVKDLDVLFGKNGIKYSLCGGSLLGAIRENGFIPWDDDIDIMMDRENFVKTIGLFGEKRVADGFVLKRKQWVERIFRNRDNLDISSAPCIDIFVIDRCPDNTLLRKYKVNCLRILQGMMKEEKPQKEFSAFYKLCLKITRIIGKPFSQERKYRWYDSISQIGNSKNTRFVTSYNDIFKLLSVRYIGNLMDVVIRHRFENIELPITSEFDNYLSTQYGDYMTPPPLEERIPGHGDK